MEIAPATTVLLLHGDGSNGAASPAAFVDSSTRNHVVSTIIETPNLDTSQLKFGSASIYTRDGTNEGSQGDSLYYGDAVAGDWSQFTGDFTWDCWVRKKYAGITANGEWPIVKGGANFYRFGVDTDLRLKFQYDEGGGPQIDLQSAILTWNINQWYHLRVTRQGDDFKIYRDGAVEGSLTVAQVFQEFTGANSGLQISGEQSADEAWGGWLEEILLAHEAMSNAAFTPPTQRYQVAETETHPDTSLLIPMVGTDTSTTFVDVSPATAVVTVFGNAQITTVDPVFDGACGDFDGTNSYIQVADHPGLDFGAADFTTDFFVRFDATGGNQAMFASADGAAGSFYFRWQGGPGRWQWNDDAGSINFTDAISPNIWYFIRVARQGSTLRVFRDGVQVGGDQTTATAILVGSSGLRVARREGGQTNYPNAQMSYFRLVPGQYLTNQNPPSGPWRYARESFDTAKAVLMVPMVGEEADTTFRDTSRFGLGNCIPDGAGTVFLTHFDNATPVDAVGGHTITLQGSAVVNQDNAKMGSGCLDLTSGGYAEMADDPDFEVPGELNIEFWIYPTSNSAPQRGVYCKSENTAAAMAPYRIDRDSSGNMILHVSLNGSTWAIITSFGVALINQWTHIAVSLDGSGDWRAFVNGGLGLTVNVGGTPFNNTAPVTIGRLNAFYASRDFTGYIDQVRHGQTALRTASFIPPSAPFCPGAPGTDVFAAGNAALTIDEYRHPVSAGEFDGSGDFVYEIVNQNRYRQNDLDFTLHGWVRRGAVGVRHVFVAHGEGSVSANIPIQIEFSAGNVLTAFIGYGSGFHTLTHPTPVTDTGWHHVALIRSVQDMHLALDGVRNTVTVVSQVLFPTPGRFFFGGYPDISQFLTGNMSEWIYLRGDAVWTSNFTPPAGRLSLDDVPVPFPLNQTRLYVDCNGLAGSTTFTDQGMSGFTVVANGGAQVSDDFFVGDGALALGGGGDFLSIADSASLVLSGDFTIFLWIKTVVDGVEVMGQGDGTAAGTSFQITIEDGDTLRARVGFGGSFATVFATSVNVVDDSWHHIAVISDSGTLRLYVDGLQEDSAGHGAINDSSSSLLVGSGPDLNDFNGKMDDFGILDSALAVNGDAFAPCAPYSLLQPPVRHGRLIMVIPTDNGRHPVTRKW